MSTIAPAAKAILAQATLFKPFRSKASDGTLGDQAHAARVSDHNPDNDGVVLAADLTHDPAGGVDAHGWIRWRVAKGDPRIKYAISQGQIWSPEKAKAGWRPYTGANRHDKHCHVSIVKSRAFDASEWFDGWFNQSEPVTPPPLEASIPATSEEDDMYFLHSDGLGLFFIDGGGAVVGMSPAQWEAVTAANPSIKIVKLSKDLAGPLVYR